MKRMLTITIENASDNDGRHDAVIMGKAIAEGRLRMNGSDIHVHETNADNTEEMHYTVTRLLRWSGGARAPGRRRSHAKEKHGIIAGIIGQIKEGLTQPP